MTTRKLRTGRVALAVLAIGLAQAATAAATERITATIAVPPGTPGSATTVPLSAYIYDYSTDDEFRKLSELLASKGSKALREALFDLEKGWLRLGDSLGYPIALARSETKDGSRHILLVADRPIQFFEIWNDTRSLDYPFSVIELNVKSDGTGDGQLVPAAKVRLSNGKVQVESYTFQPSKLLGVRVR
jgi:hypothetical protein